MKVLQKWDYRLHAYMPHLVPGDWKVSQYESNMDARINCAECGKELPFGDSYVSMKIHDDMGFGYCVCEHCYDAEWTDRMLHEAEGEQEDDHADDE